MSVINISSFRNLMNIWCVNICCCRWCFGFILNNMLSQVRSSVFDRKKLYKPKQQILWSGLLLVSVKASYQLSLIYLIFCIYIKKKKNDKISRIKSFLIIYTWNRKIIKQKLQFFVSSTKPLILIFKIMFSKPHFKIIVFKKCIFSNN